MELNTYQAHAISTRMESANEAYALLGLIGELGEVYSIIAKAIRDGNEIDDEKLKKELGDLLWFVAVIATDMNFTLNEVAEANVAKLQSRMERNTLHGSGDDR
jgi:NTP pyrophosphatase (non-canonical NTP hydrolase)